MKKILFGMLTTLAIGSLAISLPATATTGAKSSPRTATKSEMTTSKKPATQTSGSSSKKPATQTSGSSSKKPTTQQHSSKKPSGTTTSGIPSVTGGAKR